jgi:hypothetical protein
MATNLIQLADHLRTLPDQALQQELQAPSGIVPPYLVLAEAQRRSLMRSGAQSQQPQQSNVLQDTIRALNAHNMPPNGPGMPPPPANVPPGMPPASLAPRQPSGLGAAAPPRMSHRAITYRPWPGASSGLRACCCRE